MDKQKLYGLGEAIVRLQRKYAIDSDDFGMMVWVSEACYESIKPKFAAKSDGMDVYDTFAAGLRWTITLAYRPGMTDLGTPTTDRIADINRASVALVRFPDTPLDDERLYELGNKILVLLQEHGLTVESYTMKAFVSKPFFDAIKEGFTNVYPDRDEVFVISPRWLIALQHRLPIGSEATGIHNP